jgi:DNA-binding protein
MPEDNIVFVGTKPTNCYCLAVLTQVEGGQEEIFIKARGRSISRAVDVAQVTVNRYLKDFKVGDIEIGTEQRDFIPREVTETSSIGTDAGFKDFSDARTEATAEKGTVEPKKINVSTISIQLIKK